MNKALLSLLTLFIILIGSTLYGQNPKIKVDEGQKLGSAIKSEVFELAISGKINAPSADLDWNPSLVAKIQKVEHSMPGKEELMAIKAAKALVKTSNANLDGEGDDSVGDGDANSLPIVGNDFAGNPNNGSSPMDNSIAISNDGIIISVANTTIQYKNTGGATMYSNSIVDFIDDPAISYVCDPVVLYDPQADRFIFFAQECSGHSSNSKLLILFSQTNDPTDGWNYYKLTGNPLGDNSWFDYPKLAISDSELFITGNLFTNAGYYNESVVYQMDKNDGYAGGALTWQYWSDIPGDPGTLLVVSSGNEFNYGPGIYIVSTNPYSGNHIKFYDITDEIGGSPEMNYYTVSTDYFDVAADSDQLGTGCKLDNGDCRCLSGFYLNGTIHFVFQSDAGGGWNGINYNRLDVLTLTNSSDIFGDSGNNDYSYPSVSWFGISPLDKSVLIGFGAASSSIYPEMRVVHCNHIGDWSETTVVKESSSYASFTSPSTERWGDYTGISRVQNAVEPTVWVSGSYGTASHYWNTWIAEIHATYAVSIEEEDAVQAMSIAPNPIVETFNLNFEVSEHTAVIIQIIGINGEIVKVLYEGTAYSGTNYFAFDKSNLSTGTYFLQVISNQNQIANEKIIIL